MNKFEMKRLVRHTLREFGHRTEKVAVEINGQLDYYTEREIRALQVIAARKAKESEAEFKEFCDTVTVYSGRYKRKSLHTMHFRKDGKFSDEFEDGFYDVNSNLAFELL